MGGEELKDKLCRACAYRRMPARGGGIGRGKAPARHEELAEKAVWQGVVRDATGRVHTVQDPLGFASIPRLSRTARCFDGLEAHFGLSMRCPHRAYFSFGITVEESLDVGRGILQASVEECRRIFDVVRSRADSNTRASVAISKSAG